MDALEPLHDLGRSFRDFDPVDHWYGVLRPRKMLPPSFRDRAKHETRNLEIPGSMLRIAPE
jgi:hypothetical protein